MRSFIVRFLVFLSLSSCVKHDLDPSSPKESVRIAAFLCKKSPADMQWYTNLLSAMEKDPAQLGDIYAATVDGKMIFIHQPMIMSCLACVLYDCDGNKIDYATLDHEKVRTEMTFNNRVFRAY